MKILALSLALVLTSTSTTSTCTVYREAALTWKAVAEKRAVERDHLKTELDEAVVALDATPPETTPVWVWPSMAAATLGGFVLGFVLSAGAKK